MVSHEPSTNSLKAELRRFLRSHRKNKVKRANVSIHQKANELKSELRILMKEGDFVEFPVQVTRRLPRSRIPIEAHCATREGLEIENNKAQI